MTSLFPGIMAALAVAASIVYFAVGDWRHGLYWAASAVITIAVTI